MILLVYTGKIIVLRVRHPFWYISLTYSIKRESNDLFEFPATRRTVNLSVSPAFYFETIRRNLVIKFFVHVAQNNNTNEKENFCKLIFWKGVFHVMAFEFTYKLPHESIVYKSFILYIYVSGASTSPHTACFSREIEAKARSNNRAIVMFARTFIFNGRSGDRSRRLCLNFLLTPLLRRPMYPIIRRDRLLCFLLIQNCRKKYFIPGELKTKEEVEGTPYNV